MVLLALPFDAFALEIHLISQSIAHQALFGH
jgi:hypothetical protein